MTDQDKRLRDFDLYGVEYIDFEKPQIDWLRVTVWFGGIGFSIAVWVILFGLVMPLF